MKAEEIIEELRLARFRSRIKQTELAKQINAERSTLGGWESGRRDPSLDGLVRWAAALGKKITVE